MFAFSPRTLQAMEGLLPHPFRPQRPSLFFCHKVHVVLASIFLCRRFADGWCESPYIFLPVTLPYMPRDPSVHLFQPAARMKPTDGKNGPVPDHEGHAVGLRRVHEGLRDLLRVHLGRVLRGDAVGCRFVSVTLI